LSGKWVYVIPQTGKLNLAAITMIWDQKRRVGGRERGHETRDQSDLIAFHHLGVLLGDVRQLIQTQCTCKTNTLLSQAPPTPPITKNPELIPAL